MAAASQSDDSSSGEMLLMGLDSMTKIVLHSD
jgi:hypothetical protein